MSISSSATFKSRESVRRCGHDDVVGADIPLRYSDGAHSFPPHFPCKSDSRASYGFLFLLLCDHRPPFRATLHRRRVTPVTLPGFAIPGSTNTAQLCSGRGPFINDVRAVLPTRRSWGAQIPMRPRKHVIHPRITVTTNN